MKSKKPTVYSCSGCSSAAQMANYLALQLDRSGAAQMSCIAGVGGDVRSLVLVAKKSEFIVSIDGCHLKCTQACLARHDVKSDMPIVLSDYGVEKKLHSDFSIDEAAELLKKIESELKKTIDTISEGES